MNCEQDVDTALPVARARRDGILQSGTIALKLASPVSAARAEKGTDRTPTSWGPPVQEHTADEGDRKTGRRAASGFATWSTRVSRYRTIAENDEGDLAVSSNRRRPADDGSKRAKVDGRFLRTERTRQRIIESFLALLRSGMSPTSNEIAAHAGCSIRSVFERFHDMAALRVAAADYLFAAAGPVLANETAGDRQSRLQSHVGALADLCERIMPLWRTMLVHQGGSPPLREHIAQTRSAARAMTEQAFACELATLTADRRRQILVAIESIIDFDSWSRMRDHHGLSFAEASMVWLSTVDRLLPRTP